MGSVGNFLFGGSDQSQQGQNSSNEYSHSSNEAENSNAQASQSTSNQSASNASGSANQSYGELNAALMPSLGYVNSAGNMMGALLGLPASTFNYTTPPPSVLPNNPAPAPTGSGGSGSGNDMVSQLFAKYMANYSPPLVPPPTPPTPLPPTTPPTTTTPLPPSGHGSGDGPPYCVTVDTPVLMADGSTKVAGDLLLNDKLYTMHEHTKVWGKYPVVAKEIAYNQKLYKAVIDGKVLRGTADHRVYTNNDWHSLGELGDPDGHGSVVKLTVKDAHTYVSNGIVSHNVKLVPGTGDPSVVQHRADGGPVQAGQPYVVGERQPELFVPHTSGTIIPQVPGMTSGRPGGIQMASLTGHPGQMSPGGGGTGVPLQGNAPGSSVGQLPNAPVQIGGTATPGGGMTGAPIQGSAPGSSVGQLPTNTVAGMTPSASGLSSAPSPTDALNTFANSSGMNFILDQGQKALSGASAANGTFNSGATGKALTQYGQNLGSTYLNDYMNHLLDYAKLGLGSASALSGAGNVSQGIGSSTGGSNSSSFGYGSGTSDGSATSIGTSQGTSSGSGDSKKGLIPDILG